MPEIFVGLTLLLCAIGAASGAVVPGGSRPTTRSSPSPEIHADHTVTFRLKATHAKSVFVQGSIIGKMHRGAGGTWALTVGPLIPNVYYYHFVCDGLSFADPLNPWSHNGGNSQLLIPGATPSDTQPWEAVDVPHGSVHVDYYTSPALPRKLRRCHVYTPPAYDARATTIYPTLYLLHGHGDDDSNWTDTGRANFILDSLIAGGTARPMVVVMPDGGSLDTMSTDRFVDDILTTLIPRTEQNYRVSTNPSLRAVAGLSMGGGHATHLAFDHPGTFGAVAIWSAGWRNWQDANLSTLLPRLLKDPTPFNKMNPIVLSCGRDDGLLPVTESLDSWLARKGVHHDLEITPGSHAWTVWRAALIRLLPRLFPTTPAAAVPTPQAETKVAG